VTILRKGHAFEGKALIVIGSIKRRGALLFLVILPNGSRSHIPGAWTDWDGACASEALSSAGDPIPAASIGRLADLLQLSKVVEALRRRRFESASSGESIHAVEPGVSRSSQSAESCVQELGVGRLGPTGRSRPRRRARKVGELDCAHVGGSRGRGGRP